MLHCDLLSLMLRDCLPLNPVCSLTLQLTALPPAGMEELPRDFTKMFDYDVFKFDVDLIPQAKVSEPAVPLSPSLFCYLDLQSTDHPSLLPPHHTSPRLTSHTPPHLSGSMKHSESPMSP